MRFCWHIVRSLTQPSTDSSTTAEHAVTGDSAEEAKAGGAILEAEDDDTVWMLYLGEFTSITSRK